MMEVDVGERRGIGECGPFGPYIAEKRKSGKSGVECIGVYIISENVVARHRELPAQGRHMENEGCNWDFNRAKQLHRRQHKRACSFLYSALP